MLIISTCKGHLGENDENTVILFLLLYVLKKISIILTTDRNLYSVQDKKKKPQKLCLFHVTVDFEMGSVFYFEVNFQKKNFFNEKFVLDTEHNMMSWIQKERQSCYSIGKLDQIKRTIKACTAFWLALFSHKLSKIKKRVCLTLQYIVLIRSPVTNIFSSP
jgi:hypothetical protein